MKLKHFVILAIVAIAIIIAIVPLCISRMTSLTISGQTIGLGSESIYIEESYGENRIIVDSAKLSKSGEFKFTIKNASADPTLYELRYEWDRVPVLGKRGEKITVSSIGSFSLNYMVEGSDESVLLREFYQPYIRGREELRKVAMKYASQQESGDDLAAGATAKEYSRLYNEIKRDQIKFIVGHKGHMSAIYALAQRLPGDSYMINEVNDIVYMRTVADSVSANYPNSSYVKSLKRDLEEREAQNRLLNNIESINYPEIKMNDMFGKEVSLSSLEGSVILLDFWSAELGRGNQNNAEMKELYREFKSKGLEIYQVGVDTSKSVWINAVQRQRLPWISVSDFKGGQSPVLGLYNVTDLPSNLLINRNSEIVARDIYGEELRAAIEKEL